MNPTRLEQHIFVDAIPIVRALSEGVGDGYPRGHYVAIAAANQPTAEGDPHPVFSRTQNDPHALFKHPRYAAPPERETEAERFDRDAEHRAAALEALSPEVAAAFGEVSAADAELAGLCKSELWEDEKVTVKVTVMVKGEEREEEREETRLGVRSRLRARGASAVQ